MEARERGDRFATVDIGWLLLSGRLIVRTGEGYIGATGDTVKSIAP